MSNDDAINHLQLSKNIKTLCELRSPNFEADEFEKAVIWAQSIKEKNINNKKTARSSWILKLILIVFLIILALIIIWLVTTSFSKKHGSQGPTIKIDYVDDATGLTVNSNDVNSGLYEVIE